MGFRNFPGILFTLMLVTALAHPSLSAAEPQWLLYLEQSLEKKLLARLAQAQKDMRINAFASDGCSGGMSEAWVFLGQTLPRFAETFGDRPVWEECCIAHDRNYWQGEIVDGFNKRLQADVALRSCVQGYGPRLAPELSARHGISSTSAISIFDTAGEIMYQAVRAGGKPCSFLPWRWGYGWPQCPLFTPESASTK